MKQKFNLPALVFMVMMTFILSSCSKEKGREIFPLSAEVFTSIVDKQVAFTPLTHSAVSWSWDFGDGTTSTEQNPVHIYKVGGYYVATLTAKDAAGATAVKSVALAIALTPYAMLTGDHTATGYKGKTWRLTAAHSSLDKLANADAALSLIKGSPFPLPSGAFGLYLGLGEAYEDTYTFYFDGKYVHDVKADNAAFGGIAYQLKTNGGANIVKMSASPSSYPFCNAKYTPQSGATFTYVEKEDFVVPSVFGPPTYTITYKGVSTMDFSCTEFIGFMDKQRKVIVQDVTDNSMRLAMFASLDPTYYPLNTSVLILSFEVVK